ncbi:MAG: hypothetical protein H0W36_09610 [Gemmatimonadetes bacterium]|nr:hypothetical protein [Gemmatimonadota bacterium]
MTAGGWVLMIAAWVTILGVTVWCLARVLGAGGHEEFDNPEPPVPPTG